MKSLSRFHAFCVLAVLWAAIYLPGLGTTEFKGEEGRRVLPAVAMLEDGNWLVPHLGGKPYLRKPPLMNWLIAASFSATGRRDEWAARMPAAILVLVLGATVIGLSSGGGWLTPRAGLLAALMVITPFGLLAKARFAGAEIEGVYVPLSGMAIAIWMAWYAQRRSPWLLWIVPGIFLGLAALAKGPSFHLVAYYVVVLATLGTRKQWKQLFHPAHLLGIMVAAGIFCAWAIPFSKNPEAASAGKVWKQQGVDRFREVEFAVGDYFLNLPRGLMDQLPWILFAPTLARGFQWWRRKSASLNGVEGRTPDSEKDAASETKAGRVFAWCAVFWAVLLMVPGMLPRYVLPFGIVFFLVLAKRIEDGRISDGALRTWHWVNTVSSGFLLFLLFLGPVSAGWPVSQNGLPMGSLGGSGFRFERAFPAGLVCVVPIGVAIAVLVRRGVALHPTGLAVRSCALLGVVSVWYSVAVLPWLALGERSRPLAREIDAVIPQNNTLVVCDPDYLPALFYLRTRYVCVASWRESVKKGGWILMRETEWTKRLNRRETGGWEKVWGKSGVQGGAVCLIQKTGSDGTGL